jgi:two-component system response regulator AtoC
MDTQKTVLVVDEQSPIRYILKQMLNKLGYQCIFAAGGEDALKIIGREDNLNMLLCDIHMPDINGLEVLETCKTINPKLPVVLMSAYSKDETIVEALRKGASDYLIKPFEIMQLKSVVDRVEGLYHNRNQIIENRDLLNSLELNFEIPSKDIDVGKIQSILKSTIQIYSGLSNKDLLNLSLIIEESVLNAH